MLSIHSLLAAIREGREKKLRELLQGAASLPASGSGATPLQMAAIHGRWHLIEMLVEFGCNVNEQDMDGWTPLYTAARYNHYDVARELLYFRADPEIRAVRPDKLPIEVATTPNMRFLIGTRGINCWRLDLHRYAPQEMRDVVKTMLMIRTFETHLAVSWLPNELLFIIFEFM